MGFDGTVYDIYGNQDYIGLILSQKIALFHTSPRRMKQCSSLFDERSPD